MTPAPGPRDPASPVSQSPAVTSCLASLRRLVTIRFPSHPGQCQLVHTEIKLGMGLNRISCVTHQKSILNIYKGLQSIKSQFLKSFGTRGDR